MKKQSPAFALLAHVWKHSPHHGKSWPALNHAMQDAVGLAIAAGLAFDKDDFGRMIAEFRGGRWFGADDGESFYVEAVLDRNASACLAYEHYRERKPFIAEDVTPGRKYHHHPERKRERLTEGSRFTWKGQRVTVTSFAKDGQSLTACSYKEPLGGSYEHKVAKKFRITIADIQADRQERKGKG